MPPMQHVCTIDVCGTSLTSASAAVTAKLSTEARAAPDRTRSGTRDTGLDVQPSPDGLQGSGPASRTGRHWGRTWLAMLSKS